ncbi:MAG: hypothetical protein IKW96_07335 [Ruminococcus sp.]|uniref:dockerin type I domain-containing protein n=1 Tax=Ruminococcus sp. TaxID=41978 RepID=UPI0025FBD395|nr:dockerin type I domain-containing protein [Ruminococcus sp.]MBR5683077.1 hypothetical protein [Ruminococcus sp.]
MKGKVFIGALASAAASLLLAAASVSVGASAAWKKTGLIGDINGDGAVNIADIVTLSKHLRGTEKLGEDSVFRMADGSDYIVRTAGKDDVKLEANTRSIQKADLDRNGAVEVFDLVQLRKVVIASSPCGEIMKWEEDPKPATTTTTVVTTTTATTTTAPPPPPPPPQKKDFIEPPLADMYGSMPSQGKVNLLIFYVDFTDCRFEYDPSVEEIERIAFGKEDDKSASYPFESFSAFYKRASKGALELSGKAYKYTCEEKIAKYGDDEYKSLFAEEVISKMDDIVDYSQFDANGDHVIDAILFCVPGSSGNDWWSCAGQYYGEALTVDGMTPGHMITGNAAIKSSNSYITFISTYSHEIAHCMGLPDYYLYNEKKDIDGMHGSAGFELMDEAYSDLSAVSKLMLGWLREDQVQVYDPEKGEQTFTIVNGQTDGGNCLIIPRGDLNGYKSEFFIVEYTTLEGNNSLLESAFRKTRVLGSGISVKHIEADIYTNIYGTFFKYQSGHDEYTNYNKDRRFIRLVNDAEGDGRHKTDNFFYTGDVISNAVKGFAWYDSYGSETVDPNLTITVGELKDNAYTVTVSRK